MEQRSVCFILIERIVELRLTFKSERKSKHQLWKDVGCPLSAPNKNNVDLQLKIKTELSKMFSSEIETKLFKTVFFCN